VPDEITQTVGALFVKPNGEVLLGLRAPWKTVWPSHWDAIGGHVEGGESLDAALIREVQEEVGVTPVEMRLLTNIAVRDYPRYAQLAVDLV
jgi:8-oxo-dGTP diphosphatase